MNPNRSCICCATPVALLALVMLLALPFAAFSKPAAAVPQTAAMAGAGCCGGCPTDLPAGAPVSPDGCGAAEGCCSACGVPLGTRVLLPERASATGRLAACDPLLQFPEVYLPIFVPPEGRS